MRCPLLQIALPFRVCFHPQFPFAAISTTTFSPFFLQPTHQVPFSPSTAPCVPLATRSVRSDPERAQDVELIIALPITTNHYSQYHCHRYLLPICPKPEPEAKASPVASSALLISICLFSFRVPLVPRSGQASSSLLLDSGSTSPLCRGNFFFCPRTLSLLACNIRQAEPPSHKVF
jgi:hypothetical protein